MTDGYDASARQRLVPEPPKPGARTAFERDRARVLHSAALRRLAGKTQVVVAGELDFPRTRLTHSLEVAQIGRELGQALGCDPDLVEVAGLSHDLGHPPFGHNGEQVLAQVAKDCGGFEGNAQTLRVLTRLEAKAFRPGLTGRSVGLNLTRATLDAATKYPWLLGEGPSPGPKFGAYADDREVFDWMREGVPAGRRCLEAQVMDWADDIAYSVHDVEDALHAGHLRLEQLSDPVDRAEVVALAVERYAPGTDPAELADALDGLRAQPWWPAAYDGSVRGLAGLKNLTSQLIGRLCGAAEGATREQFGPGVLTRYAADLVVPGLARLECAALKAVSAVFVMQRTGQQRTYADQRVLVFELTEAVLTGAPTTLSAEFLADFEAAADDGGRLRVVIDQVASLTDTSAVAWHTRLVLRGQA